MGTPRRQGWRTHIDVSPPWGPRDGRGDVAIIDFSPSWGPRIAPPMDHGSMSGEYQNTPHFVPKNPPFWRKMYQKTPSKCTRNTGGGGFGTFWEVFWYILAEFCGAIRGFYGTIQGVSSTYLGVFSTFYLVSFWYFCLIPSGSEMWEPMQGVRCIVRTVSLPSPKIVCPGLALYVVHVAGPFCQISGMEVGEGMEIHVLGAGGLCELQKVVEKRKSRGNPSWGFF